MENIILTNNKDLRLVGVKVGVLSTLRFELPLVSASATHVEVIVTSGDVHSAYTATFISDTKRWQCDIAASQFPAVGKQSYEIAYELDGKQFWDGKGWIEIEDATTSGIEPQPRPEPYRYAVVSVNGYGADAQGAVRIPKTFISANSPVTTEGYIEGDVYFNSETGATWTLCNVQSTLTWVFNYKNYYTKAETEEAIDRVAAYYITYDAAGNPFPTYAALANATTVYSGGSVRVPTRNDYCVVLADETHDNAEYRYIYAVAEGEATGSWQPQFPVEGVMTVDQTVTKNSTNPVSGGGIWSAIWGALASLPAGFSSLYDWAVAQLAGKASKSDATLTDASEWRILHTPLTAEQKAAFYAENEFAESNDYKVEIEEFAGEWHLYVGGYLVAIVVISEDGLKATFDSSQSQEATTIWGPNGTTVATRTALSGYQLGPDDGLNPNKPLASEAEAEALRQGKQSALSAQQLANIAAVSDALAFDATHTYAAGDPVVYDGTLYTFTSAHTGAWTGSDVSAVDIIARLAGKLDKSGGTMTGPLAIDVNLPDGDTWLELKRENEGFLAFHWGYISFVDKEYGFPGFSGTLALAADTGHAGNLAALDANGNPTDAGWTAGELARYSLVTKTIDNGAVTLDDRAINAVAVSSSLASLTVNFPTATSGKVRDFAMRLNIAAGVTAPEIAWPQGVTLENDGGEVPEIADGGTGGSSTILYFSETENNGTTAKFLVKGETLTAIAQA